MDNQKAYLIGGLALLVFIMGWISHAISNNALAQAIEETRKEAAMSAAQEIAKITVSNTNVYNKVIERTRTETVYQDCQHSSDTFNLINEAFTK